MRFRVVVNGEAHEVSGSPGRVALDGRALVGSVDAEGHRLTVRIGSRRIRVLLTRWGAIIDDAPYRVHVSDLDLGEAGDSAALHGGRDGGRVEVRPPMPGRVVRLAVHEGDRVARHQPLAVLEAMKMQNEVPAPVAGIVREVRVSEGQRVVASDVLVVLEPS